MISKGYLPLITKPTCITDHSDTLIDHMYTNTTSLDYVSGIIISDVSDHFGTFYISIKKAPDVKSKYSYIRQTKQHNINALKQILSDTDFTPVFSTEDPTESYYTVLDIYKLAYDIACPVKKIKLSNKYIKREPWITQGLIHSSMATPP